MKHELILHKIDGSRLNLYNRNATSLSTVTSGEQRQTLNSDDIVMITVESAVKITFDIGDRLNVFGRWYKINRLPTVKKTGNRLFTYNIELEGVQYDLARVVYDLTIDTTSNALQDVQADMLTGNLQRFATVLISNANRVFPGKWVLGDCPAETEDKTLVFGETDNCLLVLQRLCSEYNTEFEIIQAGDVNTLHFRKAGQIYPYTFEYGKGKGLYSLERLNVSTSNIVTRLKVYGGTRNITAKYRAARLCLPGKTKGQSYIQKTGPANNYGIWEATKIFEHIYPKRTGTVTAIDSGNVLKLTDSTMNFDLNEKEADGITTKYLIDGSPAKIHFNTGNLSGYEFEIQSYDHATKTFTLKPFEDERGERFPSEKSSAFKFAVNDKYVLLDIALPQSYIDEAEAKLQTEGNTYYDQNSQPKVQYSLEVAEDFLKELSGEGSITNIFSVGDYIPVRDTDIDVDKSVRVQSFTRDLLNPFSYKLNISDTVTTTITNRVISELIDIDKIVKINNLKDPARARRDWRSAQELLDMIFDTEGDYYSEKIKPGSIETQMLSVGAKSTQFGLVGTVIQANYNGNKNLVNVKGGVLTHYTIEEDGRIWNLADNTTTLTGDSTPYYIYAKCQRVGTAGSVIFSTEQIKVEQDPDFYHFFVGVVNSVDTGLNVRSVALTYGFTTVNGRFVRTGRIQSNNGSTYFDLDLGEIGGKITFASGGSQTDLSDWANDITGDIQDTQQAASQADQKAQQALNEAANIVSDFNAEIATLQQQIDGVVDNWFYPYSPTLANYPASEWTTNEIKDRHIGDTFTNTAQAPATDAGKSWRFVKNGTVYSWTQIADSDAVLALQKAAQAQSTADGKSTTFLVQPSNYKLGDMWVLNADRTVNGTAYKQGEILTATQDSATFVEAHWLKRVRYTDDTAVNNLEIGGRNLLLDSRELKNTGGLASGISRRINEEGHLEITAAPGNGDYASGLGIVINPEHGLQNGDTITVSVKVKSEDATGIPTLYLGNGMSYLRFNGEIGPEFSTIQYTRVWNGPHWSPHMGFSGISGTFVFKEIKLEKGNKPTDWTPAPEDVQTEIDLAKQEALTASNNVQTNVDSLNTYVDGAFKDGVIDEAEAKAIEKYKNSINESMSKAEASFAKVFANTYLEGAAKTALENAKINLWGQRDTLLSTINTAIADGKTTIAEKNAVDSAFTSFNSLMSAFQNALEEANKAIQDKLKSYADAAQDTADDAAAEAADALAKANTSKAITDKFATTIDGGLINTVMMLLRDLNSVIETAGISGIQGVNGDDPSMWSGGTYEQAFALIEFLSKMSTGVIPSNGEYASLAKITMLHNGAAKIGDFFVEESGRISMIDPGTAKSRLVFSVNNIPPINELMGLSTGSGSINNARMVLSDDMNASYALPNKISITKEGSSITVNTSIGLTVNMVGKDATGFITFRLKLYRNGVYYAIVEGVSTYLDNIDVVNLSTPVNKTIYDCPTGEYSLLIDFYGSIVGDKPYSFVGVVEASTLSWRFYNSDIRRIEFGLDGFFSMWENFVFHVSKNTGLTVSGNINMPGVLLSGDVSAAGVASNVWGSKKVVSGAQAALLSAGTFRIYHTIGHSVYNVFPVPDGGVYMAVKAKTATYADVEFRNFNSGLTSVPFQFLIVGKNY